MPTFPVEAVVQPARIASVAPSVVSTAQSVRTEIGIDDIAQASDGLVDAGIGGPENSDDEASFFNNLVVNLIGHTYFYWGGK